MTPRAQIRRRLPYNLSFFFTFVALSRRQTILRLALKKKKKFQKNGHEEIYLGILHPLLLSVTTFFRDACLVWIIRVASTIYIVRVEFTRNNVLASISAFFRMLVVIYRYVTKNSKVSSHMKMVDFQWNSAKICQVQVYMIRNAVATGVSLGMSYMRASYMSYIRASASHL